MGEQSHIFAPTKMMERASLGERGGEGGKRESEREDTQTHKYT
jgi:hypothetical protein